MTRRSLLKVLGGIVPLGATVRLERPVTPEDLVVIEVPDRLTLEEHHRFVEMWRFRWERENATIRPRVIVLDRGAKLSVHRGIIRIEDQR